MGDVCERAAVDEGRVALQCLDEVRLESVFEQGGHGAFGFQVVGRDRFAGAVVGDDGAGEAGLQVRKIRGETQGGHDFGGDGDIETVLPGNALHAAAEAVNDIAQLAVVHVDAAAPGDVLDVDVEFVALLDVVVQHGGKEVIGRPDGVEVTGEVEVDVLHGDDLGISAAGRTPFEAEDRSERGFTQSEDRIFAELTEGIADAHRGGRLSLPCRRGVDGRDEDQFGRGTVFGTVQQRIVHLGLVFSVVLEVVLAEAELRGDGSDVLRDRLLGDFNVALVTHTTHTFRAGSWCPFVIPTKNYH